LTDEQWAVVEELLAELGMVAERRGRSLTMLVQRAS